MEKRFKYLLTIAVLVIFAIGFGASDESDSSKETLEEVPTQMEHVSVETMFKNLKENAMRAQSMYHGKWFEISGLLGTMDSEGSYFSLEEMDQYSFNSVFCSIPKERRSEITDKLINMQKGDLITVKGKITDMGEVMGYTVKIVDVYPYKRK